MDYDDYKRLKHYMPLNTDYSPIYPYAGEEPLSTLGSFSAIIDSGCVHVVDGQGGSLLSWRASRKLKLIDTVNFVMNNKTV